MKELAKIIDHTLLDPCASLEDILKVAREAKDLGAASICLPPSYIKEIRAAFPDLVICTVVGFPLGYSSISVKAFEAKTAIEDGADEIDMVINIGRLKARDLAYIEEELKSIREATRGKVLKVIVETCLLNQEEKELITDLVYKSGADYIKTSTGFSKAGASLEDIKLFKNLHPDLKVKAAGGVSDLEMAKKFYELGSDRIGSSSLLRKL